ncbi:unnamed protein product [Discula destructiva]
MPIDDFLRDFLWLCRRVSCPTTKHREPFVPGVFLDWFEQAKLLEIHGHSIEHILRSSNETIDMTNWGLSDSEVPNQDEHVNDTFFGRFFDTVVRWSLRLMVTCNGHVGMVPEKAEKGDVVCVLFGCSVPVLLRRHLDSWTIVGECFLDGYMDGAGLIEPNVNEMGFCIE